MVVIFFVDRNQHFCRLPEFGIEVRDGVVRGDGGDYDDVGKNARSCHRSSWKRRWRGLVSKPNFVAAE